MIPARPLVLGTLIVVGPLALILGAWWDFLSISSFLVGTLAIALVRTRQVVGPGPVEDRVWLGHLGRALRGSVLLLGTATIPCVLLFLFVLNGSISRRGLFFNPVGFLAMMTSPGWLCSLLVRRWLGWQSATRKPHEIPTRREPDPGPVRVSITGLMGGIALVGVVLGGVRVDPLVGGLMSVAIGAALRKSRGRLKQLLSDPGRGEILGFGWNLFAAALTTAGASVLSLSLVGDFMGLGFLGQFHSSQRPIVELCVFALGFVPCFLLIRRCFRWSFQINEV